MENDLKKASDYKIRIDVYDDFPQTDDEFNITFLFDKNDTKMINFIKTCVERGKYISIYKY